MAKRRTKGDPWVYIGFHVSPDENVSLALKKVNEHILREVLQGVSRS